MLHRIGHPWRTTSMPFRNNLKNNNFFSIVFCFQKQYFMNKVSQPSWVPCGKEKTLLSLKTFCFLFQGSKASWNVLAVVVLYFVVLLHIFLDSWHHPQLCVHCPFCISNKRSGVNSKLYILQHCYGDVSTTLESSTICLPKITSAANRHLGRWYF